MSKRLTPDGLLEFYDRAGFTVHNAGSSWWYEAASKFLLGVPTHIPLDLSTDDAQRIIKDSGSFGIRYVTPNNNEGSESWQMSASGEDYSLDNFSSNTRSKLRRGIRQNDIRRIAGAELIEVGEQAYQDTVGRQQRAGRYTIDRWHRLMKAADETDGIEIWSAWNENELAAYLLVMVFEDTCELYEARSRNDKLRVYPNNALIYTVTEDMLVNRKLKEVTFGIEGLEELESLDAFKLTMGFVKKPIRQRVVFCGPVRAALSVPLAKPLIGMLGARGPKADFWRRANSLLAYTDRS